MNGGPGFYPDPGGQPGRLRHWDGQRWAPDTVPAGAPGAATAPAVGQPNQWPVGSSARGAGPPRPPARKRSGWLIGLVAVGVVLLVVAVLGIRALTSSGGGGVGPPGGTSTTKICPTQQNTSPAPQPGDGRVHGGALSYPLLGSPWAAPEPEYRVAFGQNVFIQSVVVEDHPQKMDWLAAVLVGELASGDGFYAPQQGAEIVVNCVSGTFYGNSSVTRDDQVNKAMTVDGHDAWIIESQLRFDIPGIEAKSERLIVVIIDTGAGTAGLFYASIPENAPELLQPARGALTGLTVDQ